MTKSRLFKTNVLSLLLAISIACIFNSAFAAKNQEEAIYDVEIIIFSQKTKLETENEESWPENLTYPRFNKSREIFTPFEILMQKGEVAESLYFAEPMEETPDDLSNYARKLDKANFELLAYKKWRQPLGSKTKTKPVFISDIDKDYLLQTYDPSIVPEQDATEENTENSAEQQLLNQILTEEKLLNQPVQEQADFISDLDPIEPFSELKQLPSSTTQTEASIGPPNHKVYGLFKVFKSRHPHLSFNVFYKYEEPQIEEQKKPAEEFPMENNLEENSEADAATIDTIEQEILDQNKLPISALQLNVSSRIRINELHYFDHPKFGVIARVRKYEPPVSEDSSKN